jgi:hypothetical protein
VQNGCDVCHAISNGKLAGCHEWTCDAAAYNDGTTCDCGCGLPDPDCGLGAGCVEPGCFTSACEACHDPLGRATPACP